MAARYAVASGNWSGAIWAATSGGVAGSAAVPTNADDVTINKNVTVTIDNTSAVALSVALSVGTTGADVGGILTCATTTDTKLLIQKGINVAGSTGSGGAYSANLILDVSSAPSYKCELIINNAAGTAAADTSIVLGGKYTLKGAVRKRHTVTTGALTANSTTSVVVADATGWRQGDRLVFISTQAYYSTPRTDVVTIATITPGSGTTATITWTDGTGTGGAVAYDHATDCIVGNFTSNLRIGPAVAGNKSQSYSDANNSGQQGTPAVEHVLFDGMNPADSAFRGGFGAYLKQFSGVTVRSNAFYDFSVTAMSLNQPYSPTGIRDNNIFYTTRASTTAIGGGNAGAADVGDEEDFVIFRAATGLYTSSTGCDFIRGHVSGCTNAVDQGSSSGRTHFGCEFFGNNRVRLVSNTASANTLYDSCGIGTRYSGATNATLCDFQGAASLVMQDCDIDLTGTTIASGLTAAGNGTYLQFLNKDVNPAVQEVYRNTSNTLPVLTRDTSVKSNATSSLLMDFIGTGNIAQSWTATIPVKAGEALTVLLYVRKNSSYGASTLPFATLTGLGITPVTATMSGGTAADAWEMLTLSYASGSAPSADGNLTLTVTGQSATNGAKCYFSGIPLAPFVTRCRHYGYVFDETIPVRTADPYKDVAEATAAGYTGVTINNTTKAITFGAGTADTAQKFYDYSRAWCVADVSRDVPFTRAGSLFSLLSTWKVTDPAYTNTLTWGGGTVEFTSAGTKTHAIDSSDIVFAAAGTYDLSGCTISGTVELINTSGGSVTVTMPAGASVTNTGPNITVNYPTVTRGLDFAFTGGTTSRVVKIFDTGDTTAITTLSSPDYIWSEAVSGSRTLDYTVLEDGYLPIRVTGVTVTGALSGGVQAVQVQQTESRAWISPAGLTFGTNFTADTTNKYLKSGAATTIQNFYCALLSAYRTEAALANKPFPMTENGPNSFSMIDGWETRGYSVAGTGTNNTTLDNFSRDGLRYVNASGAVTAMWAALLSVGVPAGMQVRYQQQDGTGTANARNTGNIDQLIQILSDPNGDGSYADGYDYRAWLVLKVQAEGYDQAEAIAAGTGSIYGTLEDQLFVVGLTPTANSVAPGAADAAVTITFEPTPVEWPAASGKYFSTTIKDTTDTHTGLQIMQAVRDPAQVADNFNLHDMVRPNGAGYKTVNGNFYGDAYLTPAGVRVVKADGVTPHPDFNSFSSDDPAITYVPPVVAPIAWAGALNGTTVLLYNDSTAGSPIIDTQTVSGAGGYVWSITLPHADVAVGDSLRLRFGHKEYYAGELQGTMTASGLAFVGAMTLHPIYAGWGLDGATYDQANGGPFTMDGVNLEIDIGGGAGTGLKKALGAWTQHLMTLPAGLDAFYGAWDLLDLNQIRQNVAIVDVLIDKPSAGQYTFTDNDINYYRSDFSIPYNTTHSPIFMTYNAKPFVATVASSYAITGTAAEIIAAIPSAATIANEVVNVAIVP